MKIKHILSKFFVTTVALIMFCTALPVFAEDASTIKLQIDNQIMTVDGTPAEIDPGRDTSPVIVDGRTLVPIRAIIEALGGTVGWDGEKSEVTLTYKEDVIKLVINSLSAYLNDTESTLDVAPAIINERTMLPIRYIAEGFKFNVNWDGTTRIVTISKNGTGASGKPSIRVIAIGTDKYFKDPVIEEGFFDPNYFDPYGEPLGDPDGAMSAIPPQNAEEASTDAELNAETALKDPEAGTSESSSEESAPEEE